MKTINERVNEVVKIAVSDNNALKMQDTKKRIEKELSENVEFQELVKAVNDFRLSYYNGDTEYKEVSIANVRAAFRACSKMVMHYLFCTQIFRRVNPAPCTSQAAGSTRCGR